MKIVATTRRHATARDGIEAWLSTSAAQYRLLRGRHSCLADEASRRRFPAPGFGRRKALVLPLHKAWLARYLNKLVRVFLLSFGQQLLSSAGMECRQRCFYHRLIPESCTDVPF